MCFCFCAAGHFESGFELKHETENKSWRIFHSLAATAKKANTSMSSLVSIYVFNRV